MSRPNESGSAPWQLPTQALSILQHLPSSLWARCHRAILAEGGRSFRAGKAEDAAGTRQLGELIFIRSPTAAANHPAPPSFIRSTVLMIVVHILLCTTVSHQAAFPL